MKEQGIRMDLDGLGDMEEWIVPLASGSSRIPVSVEQINYGSIASLSRAQQSNLSGGKIAAIALGSAGAVVGVLWLIALSTLD